MPNIKGGDKREEKKEPKRPDGLSDCFALIKICRSKESTSMKITLENVTCLEGNIGDWEISVKKVK